jgi:hypothetical protein
MNEFFGRVPDYPRAYIYSIDLTTTKQPRRENRHLTSFQPIYEPVYGQ